MSVLTYFAGDPLYFAARESGWMWLLTPVKHTAMLAAFDANGQLMWYTPRLWGNVYLGLRVVALDLILLGLLMIVVPLLVRNRGNEQRLVGRLSAISGVLLGVLVTFFCFISFASWATLVAAVVTLGFVVAAWMIDRAAYHRTTPKATPDRPVD
jgi:hypothetical protein